MVYIISKIGKPLMPTKRHGKVRHLLETGKAKVVKRTPFTIQLLYDTRERVQPVTLGVDAGSKHIGLSASTESEELFSAQVEERGDAIVKLLASRREARRSRRHRKTRYRPARFNNRIKSKHKGWLAPSIEQKIATHTEAIKRVSRILPISKIIIETASFDTQKIKAKAEGKPVPQGEDYQKGEQLRYLNVRQYVLARDNYTCQCCKKHSTEKNHLVLHVHHIESRQTGGNAPGNLVTLCEDCHKAYHAGKIKLPKQIKRGIRLKDAAFMGIMRKTFYQRLKAEYEPQGIPVSITYGYITKYKRLVNHLEKSHCTDAYCIADNLNAKPIHEHYLIRKVRCHNRQIYKEKIRKGGVRQKKQAPLIVCGLRLNDTVKYQGKPYFVLGRRASGYMRIQALDGKPIHNGSVKVDQLTFIQHNNGWLTQLNVG